MTRPRWALDERVLFVGGTIHSQVSPFATAMLVDAGTVAWLGEDSAAHAYRDVATRIVRLDGALVTAGFVDAHVHTTATGMALTGLDLASCRSAGELLDAVAAFVRAHPGDPVLGHGWDDSTWIDPRPPERTRVDRAAAGAPVYLSRVDAHSALVSSALLATVPRVAELSGYDLAGPLRGAAHHAARSRALSTVTASTRRAAQRAARRHAASLGIVALHEMGGPRISSAEDLQGLLELAVQEPGPLVYGYWGELAADGGVRTAREVGAHGVGGDLFVDGSLGSHTAWLHTPYADDSADHTTGYLDAGQIAEHVVATTTADYSAGFHAIGDAATDAVASGLRAAAEVVGAPAVRAAGHRIEHAELLSDRTVRTCVELGVTLSVQPGFDARWGGPTGMYADRLGADRAGGLNRFADLVRDGVALAFGSDAPVTALGPWHAVRAAVRHRTPASGISARAAFAAHTRGGWRAVGQPGTGVLAPGAPAHLAVWAAGPTLVQAPDERVAGWSTDPRSGTPGLPELSADGELPRCLQTRVHGTTVFDSGELDTVVMP